MSRAKGKGPTGIQRNSLDARSKHQLNVYVQAHASDLDGLDEDDMVLRAAAATGLSLTLANLLTAQEATGAVFHVKPKRAAKAPRVSPQPDMLKVLNAESFMAAVLAKLDENNERLSRLCDCWESKK